MLQTIRNLLTTEILWTWPGSQDAGFECRCSEYKSHLGLHSKHFKGALIRVCGTTRETREGIPV